MSRRQHRAAKLSRPVLALGALGLVVGLSTGCAADASERADESRSFDAPSDRLVIVADYDLSVRSHSGKGIEVERSVPESWDRSWTMEGDTLELRADQPRFDLGASADGQVLVPEGLAVEVRMPNAELDVADLTDGVKVTKTNGDVRLREVEGAVAVSATNAEITVNASGPIDTMKLRTKNGDITAEVPGDVGYDLSTKTVNGDVSAAVTEEPGSDRALEFVTTNGDIAVTGR